MKKALLLKKYAYLLSFLTMIIWMSGCHKDDEAPARPTDNLIEIIANTEGLDSLIKLIGQPGTNNGFANQLTSGEYTVFAPNNAAFVKLLQSIGLESMNQLRSSILSEIAFYHVVANTALQSTQLDSTATALNIEPINFSREGDTIRINTSTQPNRTVVVSPNILASNGVVHVIDGVLLSSSLQEIAPYFGTVAGLVATLPYTINMDNVFRFAGLRSNLSGSEKYTVVVPADQMYDGFYSFTTENDVRAVAQYHVLPGEINLSTTTESVSTLGNGSIKVSNIEGATYLNGLRAFNTSFEVSNGSLIVLQDVGMLRPARSLDETIAYAEQFGSTFNLFKAALAQTNLDLGTDNTIFMPTDSAFVKAGFVTSIDTAARIDTNVLIPILQKHIAQGAKFYVELNAGTSTLQTLNGNIEVVKQGQSIVIADTNESSQNAQFLPPYDNLTTHGVVHVMDQLLLP